MNNLWGSELKLIIESIELNIATKGKVDGEGDIEILNELLQKANNELQQSRHKRKDQ